MPTKRLASLIQGLQSAIRAGGITEDEISAATVALGEYGNTYDHESFPRLVGTENFSDESTDSPSNLAEALLWKLGKWKSYKRFSTNFMAERPEATKTDVVFFAFAKHLKDKSNPIYDQHAIRALWAIDTRLGSADRLKCKSLLFDGSGKWKQVGSGKDSIECYEIFVAHVNDLVSGANAATMGELDRLLMPLGQAIKKATVTYAEFHSLCGWPENG